MKREVVQGPVRRDICISIRKAVALIGRSLSVHPCFEGQCIGYIEGGYEVQKFWTGGIIIILLLNSLSRSLLYIPSLLLGRQASLEAHALYMSDQLLTGD
jgi:hypothetical protein